EKPASSVSEPAPPPETSIAVKPLSTLAKTVVSVLFYHREDILAEFVRTLLLQLKAASKSPALSCELYLSFNYQPSAEALTELRQLIASTLPSDNDWVHIVENRFNLGFGRGHNAIFEKTDSDVFIVLNSDLRIEVDDWLEKFVERFRNS